MPSASGVSSVSLTSTSKLANLKSAVSNDAARATRAGVGEAVPKPVNAAGAKELQAGISTCRCVQRNACGAGVENQLEIAASVDSRVEQEAASTKIGKINVIRLVGTFKRGDVPCAKPLLELQSGSNVISAFIPGWRQRQKIAQQDLAGLAVFNGAGKGENGVRI